MAKETILPVRNETETLSYEEAARRLAEAVRSEGVGERTLEAFRQMFAAYTLRVREVVSDPELRELLPGCVALCGSDGFVHVLVRSDCLEGYLEKGLPVPEGAEIAVLHILGLSAAVEFCSQMRLLAWLASCGRFDGVWIAGLAGNLEEYVILDAEDLVRQAAGEMKELGGPRAFVKAVAAATGEPADLDLFREAKDFWRDLQERRVRLG